MTLFRDPVRWTAAAVGTKARFTVMLCLMALLTGFAVFEASRSGVRSAAGVVLFIVWMQFLMLYALRAMYLRGVVRRDPV
jgi:hypothetical protein